MAAVGVRRNDEQDAMGEFTTDLLARGEERAAHVRGISVAWLGHSMALITTSLEVESLDRGCHAHTPLVWPRMG
jgi:hypothetical protein